MTTALSSTAKAGRLIRLLGWITLVFTIAIGAAIVIPNLTKSEPIPGEIWALFGVAIFICLAYLTIGAGVKRHKRWAKIAGAVIALLSLANVPVGTLVGIAILVYLVKGWNEPLPNGPVVIQS